MNGTPPTSPRTIAAAEALEETRAQLDGLRVFVNDQFEAREAREKANAADMKQMKMMMEQMLTASQVKVGNVNVPDPSTTAAAGGGGGQNLHTLGIVHVKKKT